MIARSRALLAILGLAACGNDTNSTSGTTPVTSITSATLDPPSSSSGGVVTTGDTSAPTTGTDDPGETTNPPIDTTADDSLGTSGMMTSTTVDPVSSTTGEPPPPEGDYAAMYIAGDPARLSVRKADKDKNTCATLTFLAPADSSPLEYDVTLPAPWKVQGALIHQGAADCLAFSGFPEEPVDALSGNGSATWAGMGCPPSVDLDVLLAYPQDQPWLPAEVLMQQMAVPVSGC